MACCVMLCCAVFILCLTQVPSRIHRGPLSIHRPVRVVDPKRMCSQWTSLHPQTLTPSPLLPRHSQNSLSVPFKLWLALGSGDVCEMLSGQHWRQACVRGTSGCQTHFLSSSLFSLWLLSSPLRCPNEFTGDRCQNYVMASFYSTSISSSCLCLDWGMLPPVAFSGANWAIFYMYMATFAKWLKQ